MNKENSQNIKEHVDIIVNLIINEGIESVPKKANLDKIDLSLLGMLAAFQGPFGESKHAIEVLSKRSGFFTQTNSKKFSIRSIDPTVKKTL